MIKEFAEVVTTRDLISLFDHDKIPAGTHAYVLEIYTQPRPGYTIETVDDDLIDCHAEDVLEVD